MTPRALGFALFGAAILLPAQGAFAEGDPEAGKKVFRQCQTCHVIDKEQNRVGPHLVGIFGREAGAVPDFKQYSDALKESGIVWDDTTIAAYVADPKGFIPGNRMAYAGVKDEEDIQDLLAYLHEATGG